MAGFQFQQFLEEEEDAQKDRYLIFAVGAEYYGIEIQNVIEIINIQGITPVPEMPECIRGIINLRGKIVPVMDMRLRFRKQSVEYNERTCVIVVDIKDVSIGLIVDSVSEVLTITEENIVPPPEFHINSNRCIKGIGKAGDDVKLIVDCEMLINEEDMANIAKINRE